MNHSLLFSLLFLSFSCNICCSDHESSGSSFALSDPSYEDEEAKDYDLKSIPRLSRPELVAMIKRLRLEHVELSGKHTTAHSVHQAALENYREEDSALKKQVSIVEALTQKLADEKKLLEEQKERTDQSHREEEQRNRISRLAQLRVQSCAEYHEACQEDLQRRRREASETLKAAAEEDADLEYAELDLEGFARVDPDDCAGNCLRQSSVQTVDGSGWETAAYVGSYAWQAGEATVGGLATGLSVVAGAVRERLPLGPKRPTGPRT